VAVARLQNDYICILPEITEEDLGTMISKKIKIKKTWLDFIIPGNSKGIVSFMTPRSVVHTVDETTKQMLPLSMVFSPAVQIFLKGKNQIIMAQKQ